MANAKKCDACGKYYDDNQRFETSGRVCGAILTGVATASKGGSDKWFDLCDDCLESVLFFLHQLGGGGNDGPENVNEVQKE